MPRGVARPTEELFLGCPSRLPLLELPGLIERRTTDVYRLRLLAVISCVAFAAGGCGAASHDAAESDTTATSQVRAAQSSHAVPDVLGLTEGQAIKALSAAGFVANVRYDDDAPRTAEVVRSDPEAETDLPANSVVVLSIALEPRLPPPGQEHEGETSALGKLAQDNPDAFFGFYRDGRDVLHVVLGPGVDPKRWEDRVAAAAQNLRYPATADGRPYRVETCSRAYSSLRALQDEIVAVVSTRHDRLGFGVWVHPASCTVRVESDQLETADIRALVDRYGTAISFDTTEGQNPMLLPLQP
jgi:PASTA domain-containing protein